MNKDTVDLKNKDLSDIPVEEKKENALVSWQAPEFEFQPKDVSWYWIAVIIGIILVAIALWQKNFLFAIFVVVAEIVIFHYSSAVPKIWQFQITDRGVHIGENRVVGFKNIESFDIHEYGEDFKELILKVHGKFHPFMKIFIHTEDEKEIEKTLSRFVKKEELTTSLVDVIERIIRF